jgi:hypothetical protein
MITGKLMVMVSALYPARHALRPSVIEQGKKWPYEGATHSK